MRDEKLIELYEAQTNAVVKEAVNAITHQKVWVIETCEDTYVYERIDWMLSDIKYDIEENMEQGTVEDALSYIPDEINVQIINYKSGEIMAEYNGIDSIPEELNILKIQDVNFGLLELSLYVESNQVEEITKKLPSAVIAKLNTLAEQMQEVKNCEEIWKRRRRKLSGYLEALNDLGAITYMEREKLRDWYSSR